MKKNIYMAILTIVTVLCIIGGSLYHLLGLNPFGWKSSTIIITDSDINLKDMGTFTRIAVDTDICDVVISQGTEYGCTYEGRENMRPEISVSGGTLTIKQTGKNNWFLGLNKDSKVSVTIPSGVELAQADISSDIGDISINGINASKYHIDSDVGDVHIENSHMGNATMELDTGDATVTHCEFRSLDMDMDIGNAKITLSENLNNYRTDLSTSVGEIDVNGQSYSHGYMTQTDTDKTLTVKNSVGDIDITW